MKDKNKSAMVKRIQQRQNYSAMADAGMKVPDYIGCAYYGCSLCPDPRYRTSTLRRIKKAGGNPGK